MIFGYVNKDATLNFSIKTFILFDGSVRINETTSRQSGLEVVSSQGKQRKEEI